MTLLLGGPQAQSQLFFGRMPPAVALFFLVFLRDQIVLQRTALLA